MAHVTKNYAYFLLLLLFTHRISADLSFSQVIFEKYQVYSRQLGTKM